MHILSSHKELTDWAINSDHHLEDGLPNFIKNKVIFANDLDKNKNYWKFIIKPIEDKFGLYHGVYIFMFTLTQIEF
ncbi:hypothetical protein BGC07_12400 [Piscirickettsia litoralis]|uniref:Uncharacterized protein n=1 Tax=Piscirickettsia litoralis TaxID=1891921 RepID=A0ABX3A5R5_9GAMM|nr:hypothetical protein BGC07_12400 [Piscirickettsia litoralis]